MIRSFLVQIARHWCEKDSIERAWSALFLAALTGLFMGGCLSRPGGTPPLPYVKPANSVPQTDPVPIQIAARMQQMEAELQRLWDSVEHLKVSGGDERQINDLRQRISFIERQLGIEQTLQTDSDSSAPHPNAQTRRQAENQPMRATDPGDFQAHEQEPSSPTVEIRNPPVSTEQHAFKQAYAAFRSGAMDQAIPLFEAFLKTHPKSSLASSAIYWTGEAHFALGRYDEAVLYFDRVLKEFPGSKKELSALLKQGQAFEKMGDTRSARIIFEKLVTEYPHSVQARIASGRLKSLPAVGPDPG